MQSEPGKFIDLQDFIPNVLIDAHYATSHNFTGSPVPGYESGKLVLSVQAALALRAVQSAAAYSGLAIKVFDAYRPQRAVDYFVDWLNTPDNPLDKSHYYPGIDKAELFRQGYLVRNSSHSRGSTVDLTLVDKLSGEELDMGTPFDFFDKSSWPDSNAVSLQARANRLLLRKLMLIHGFVGLAEEWWHFTLRDEPYPDQYFDFVVS